jgi:hypothetical protein
MMEARRIGSVFFLLSVVLCTGWSQVNGEALNADLQTLFTGLGEDFVPQLESLELSGRPLPGSAELGGFFLSAGLDVSTGSGIGTVLHSSDPSTWKSSSPSIPSLVAQELGADSTKKSLYELWTGKTSVVGAFRFGFGLPLGKGFEFLADGLCLPRGLVNYAIDLSEPGSSGEFHDNGDWFGLYSLGGTLRYVLIPEARRSLRPAVSLGVQASFLYAEGGMRSFSYKKAVDGLGDVELKDGIFGIETSAETAGLVLACSKTFGIMRPFASASFRYCHAYYGSDYAATAEIGPSGSVQEVDLKSSVALNDDRVRFNARGGLELVFGPLVLTPALDLDLSSFKAEINDLSSLNFFLSGIAASLSGRIQF